MKPRAYYNEFDPAAAAWLRELIKQGLVMDGEVDTRSIADVEPTDLVGFTRCHFFAGIGGWDYALRLAGWDPERPVWTGSCPCQPFSVAGTGAGQSDVRHLWPVWADLIRQCRPDTVFGEQVEAAIRHDWLDLVQADLEREGYAVAPVVLPAAGFGSPHGRHRLWFVADAGCERGKPDGLDVGTPASGDGREVREQRLRPDAGAGVLAGVVADADGRHARAEREQPGGEYRLVAEDGRAGVVAHAERNGREVEVLDAGSRGETARVGQADERGGDFASGDTLVNAERARLEGRAGDGDDGSEPGRLDPVEDGSTAAAGFWSDCDWIPCRDGKWRPVGPGTFPLAHGVPARVGRLRGYGNAIVPQVAAEVIAAFLEVEHDS